MASQNGSHKLCGAKWLHEMAPTNCGDQNGNTKCFQQIVGSKMASRNGSNKLRGPKRLHEMVKTDLRDPKLYHKTLFTKLRGSKYPQDLLSTDSLSAK